MKICILTLSYLLLSSLYLHHNAQCQVTGSINDLRRRNVSMMIHADSASIQTNLQGTRYDLSFISLNESPFFLNSQQLTGNLIINHFIFDNLHLLYDTNSDELIYDSGLKLCKLRKEMVKQFSLFELENKKHNFVNLSFTTDDSGIQTGYFEVLYNGKSALYMKRHKELAYKLKPDMIEYYYLPDDRLYLYHKEHYHYIKTLKMLISKLNSNNEELKRFSKSKKFAKNKLIENQLIETLSYFDSLQ